MADATPPRSTWRSSTSSQPRRRAWAPARRPRHATPRRRRRRRLRAHHSYDSPTPTRTPTPTVGLPDLTVSRLEVNQAIQNDANSIPLIASKRTVVRAYVGLASSMPIGSVTGQLKGYRGATLLGTVAPFNPGGRITVVQPADWRQINHTLNFEVPFGWLTGDVRLEVEVNNDRAVAESNYGNNTASFNVRFVDGGDLRIAWLPIHYVTGGYTGPNDPTRPHRQRGRLAESHLSGQPHPRQVLSLAGHHLGRQRQHRHGRHQAAQLPEPPAPAQPDPAPARPRLRLAADQRLSAATGWRGCPARPPSATTPTAAGGAPSRTSWGTTATWATGTRRSASTVSMWPHARCGRTPGSTSWSPAGWRTKPGSRRNVYTYLHDNMSMAADQSVSAGARPWQMNTSWPPA